MPCNPLWVASKRMCDSIPTWQDVSFREGSLSPPRSHTYKWDFIGLDNTRARAKSALWSFKLFGRKPSTIASQWDVQPQQDCLGSRLALSQRETGRIGVSQKPWIRKRDTGQVRPCKVPETSPRSLLKAVGINLLEVWLSRSPGGRDSEGLIFWEADPCRQRTCKTTF